MIDSQDETNTYMDNTRINNICFHNTGAGSAEFDGQSHVVDIVKDEHMEQVQCGAKKPQKPCNLNIFSYTASKVKNQKTN